MSRASKNKIPDRWEKYTKFGQRIDDTRFICFKVPLKNEITANKRLPPDEHFPPEQLIAFAKANNVGLVIDLTNTDRYYNPVILTDEGIQHVKINCPGQYEVDQIPDVIIERFATAVNRYLTDHVHDDHLIGIHCTHGINRTGYLVCRYMIENLGKNPADAISAFEKARGHKLEKYTDQLSQLSNRMRQERQNVKRGHDCDLEEGEVVSTDNDEELVQETSKARKRKKKLHKRRQSQSADEGNGAEESEMQSQEPLYTVPLVSATTASNVPTTSVGVENAAAAPIVNPMLNMMSMFMAQKMMQTMMMKAMVGAAVAARQPPPMAAQSFYGAPDIMVGSAAPVLTHAAAPSSYLPYTPPMTQLLTPIRPRMPVGPAPVFNTSTPGDWATGWPVGNVGASASLAPPRVPTVAVQANDPNALRMEGRAVRYVRKGTTPPQPSYSGGQHEIAAGAGVTEITAQQWNAFFQPPVSMPAAEPETVQHEMPTAVNLHDGESPTTTEDEDSSDEGYYHYHNNDQSNYSPTVVVPAAANAESEDVETKEPQTSAQRRRARRQRLQQKYRTMKKGRFWEIKEMMEKEQERLGK